MSYRFDQFGMRYIAPRKRKPKRCPFCRVDIGLIYKGVHEETEIINGIPTPCRNNGKLNIHILHGYLDGSQPKENIKYFIEHPETHLWYTGYGWTNNPNEAFACELERGADKYARLKGLVKYMVTEHEFY